MYVDGRFAEDRSVCGETELRRHCEEVHDDMEETAEMQEERIMKSKIAGDRHVTEDEGIAEITVDLVLKFRARTAEEKANGPEDSVVT